VLALQAMHNYSAEINLHIGICRADSCSVYFASAYGGSAGIRMLTLVFEDISIYNSHSKNSCCPNIIIAGIGSADYTCNGSFRKY